MPGPPAATREIPRWPTITVTLNADGSGRLEIDGRTEHLAPADIAASRMLVLERVAATAATVGRPVRLHSSDPDGAWELAVHPDGHVDELAVLPAASAPAPPAATPPAPQRAGLSPGTRSARASRPRRRTRIAVAAAMLVAFAGVVALVLTNGPATVVDKPAATASRPTPPLLDESKRAAQLAASRLAAERRAAAERERRRVALRTRVAARQARARRAAAQRRAIARRAAATRRAASAAARPAPTPARRISAPPATAAEFPPPAPACGEFDIC